MLSIGVAQGSIGGPLLFNLFVNDIFSVTRHSKLALYADDTTALFIADSLEEAINMIHEDMSAIMDWLCHCGLIMNLSKTCVIKFLTPRGTARLKEGDIVIRNHQLKTVSEIKFLGVTVDNRLSFDSHVTTLKKKVVSGTAALARCRYALPPEHKLKIYFAHIESHLAYCLPLYGINYMYRIAPLHVLQKRALRLVLGIGYRDSVKEHYSKLGVLPMPLLVKYAVCLEIKRMILGVHPNILELHTGPLDTRGAADLRLIAKPAVSQLHKFTISNIGVAFWNDTPPAVRKNVRFKLFKVYMKQHFFAKLDEL